MMKQYTIPTFLALLILVISLGTGVLLIQNRQGLESEAHTSSVPQQARITNISDQGFVVSWTTEKPALGFISYGKSASSETTISDKNGSSSLVHYVVIDNLNPSTIYLFKIGSSGEIFDNNGQPYQIKTAPQSQKIPPPDVAFGLVLDEARIPLAKAIVYLTIPGVSPISAITDQFGRWSVPLSTARSMNLSSFASYNDNTPIEIFAQAGEGRSGSIKVLAGSTRPAPAITLGKNQNFTNLKTPQENNLPASQITFPQETPSGFSLEGKVTPSPKTEKSRR